MRQAETGARRLLQSAQAQLVPSQPADTSQAPGKLTPLRRALDPALLNEKAVINFANDIVAFYLIRIHWNLITQQWIKSPLRHADAWLTVFYFTFLLVRYRKGAVRSAAKAIPAPPAGDKLASERATRNSPCTRARATHPARHPGPEGRSGTVLPARNPVAQAAADSQNS